MDELRVVRREDQALILANESGEQFRFPVDSSILSELRHLARGQGQGSAAKVSPRQIQALVRAGKSREEISQLTGADESDIERYEEPVLAERRFILTTAQAVAVRTSASEEADQQFGTVIAERLVGLNAANATWSSWRDEEAGWMIALEFDSYDVSHRAVWSFDHRKGILSPITPDATSLSKLGDVGKRLIPKLRAVDNDGARDRFDSGAFDNDQLPVADEAAQTSSPETTNAPETSAASLSLAAEAALRSGHPSTGSIPIVDPDAEFARRREIDQLAIKTPETQAPDLGQTADLLDALRRRRGEREESAQEASHTQPELPVPVPLHTTEGREPGAGASQPAVRPAPEQTNNDSAQQSDGDAAGEEAGSREDRQSAEPPKRSRGRTSIPSWDDILFGTRSEDDPR